MYSSVSVLTLIAFSRGSSRPRRRTLASKYLLEMVRRLSSLDNDDDDGVFVFVPKCRIMAERRVVAWSSLGSMGPIRRMEQFDMVGGGLWMVEYVVLEGRCC